ncbi:MAG: hypothetical protein ACXVB0_04320 [Mucilaginibacter sp.]
MSLIINPVTVTYRVDKIKINDSGNERKVHVIKGIHRMVVLRTLLAWTPTIKYISQNDFDKYFEHNANDISTQLPLKGNSCRDSHHGYYQVYLN